MCEGLHVAVQNDPEVTAALSPDLTQMSDHYGLVPLLNQLDNYQPPGGAFDPLGAWTNVYRMLTMTLGARGVGELRISRVPGTGGGATLEVEMVKGAVSGATQRIEASVEVAGDVLSTPSSWSLSSRLVASGGGTIAGTAVSLAGSFAGGVVSTTVDGVVRGKPAPGPLALNWGLFDAVQRLAHGAFAGADFTLLDHFDQVKAGHRIEAAEAATISLGGVPATEFRTIELEKGTLRRPFETRSGGVDTPMVSYHQRGEGIMPTVYWATATGRLLFVTAGIEGYMLLPGQSTP